MVQLIGNIKIGIIIVFHLFKQVKFRRVDTGKTGRHGEIGLKNKTNGTLISRHRREI